MQIDSYGTFTRYEPDLKPGHPFHGQNALFIKNESGADWYDIGKALAHEPGLTFSIDAESRVVEADFEADRLFPRDRAVFHMIGADQEPGAIRGAVFDPETGTFKQPEE